MATFVMVPTAGHVTLGSGPIQVGDQCIVSVVTAQQSEEQFETMAGVTTVYGQPQYFLQLDFVQDWRAGGISAFLQTNHDTNQAFTFAATADGTPAVSGTVRCKAPAFGGNMGRAARDSVRMACVGTPTYTLDT
jgi:hypothetical protein